MFEQNPEIEAIVDEAMEIALDYSHKFVTTEHLLLALVRTKNFKTMLEEFGIDYDALTTELEQILETRFDNKA